jgi:hypothetical protein
LISFLFNSMDLKPFHLFSVLLCIIDLIQGIGYAIPLSCQYSPQLLIFGCIGKVILAAWFIFFLSLSLAMTGDGIGMRSMTGMGGIGNMREKYFEMTKTKFLIGCGISLLFPTILTTLMSELSNYQDFLCDGDEYSTNLDRKITKRMIIMVETCLVIPVLLSVILFGYLSRFILMKIWRLSQSPATQKVILGFCICALLLLVGTIPVCALTIFVIKEVENPLYHWLVVSGVCVCSEGFLYLGYYFFNNPPCPSKLQLVPPPTIGEILQRPSWSEVWIASRTRAERETNRDLRWLIRTPLIAFSSSSGIESTTPLRQQSECEII